jgi:hypothetical protein
MTYNLGQAVKLSTAVTDASGAATDATVTLTVTKPDGTTSTPSVTHDGSTGSGLYEATFTVDQTGTWWWRWDASGTVLDNDRGQLTVGDPKPLVYATLAQLRNRIRATNPADTGDDDELADALDAASRDVEDDTGRPQFWLDATATARVINPRGRLLDTREGQQLLVDDIGTLLGLVVEIGDVNGQSWSPLTDFEAGPPDALAKRWPITYLSRPYLPWVYSPRQRIRVTAHWGWPAIPSKVSQATLLRAQRLYRRKDTPEGVAGFNDMGVVRLGRYDPDYDKLISPFMAPGFGG